jgi:cobalamin biosynthesis protein CobC
MLEHGGRLRRAAEHYGIALEQWLDLSTGINPASCPLPPIPDTAWQRLPEDDDGLEAAAARYYGSDELLPVAGSQAAIQTLPAVLRGERVSLLSPSYAEHAHAWRHRNPRHIVLPADPAQTAAALEQAVDSSDIIILVHPNNPTGQCFEHARLLDWRTRLARRGGWLVVDEAFIDTVPHASLSPHAGDAGLVVLRSLGKFFGLAGLRVGFVFAPLAVRTALAERLGPWTISGPARIAATHALDNTAWQAAARTQLIAAGARLEQLLTTAGLAPVHGPALFKWLPRADALSLHHAMARRGILTRLFAAPASLRFGLPATEADWLRLQTALRDIMIERQRSPA